MRRIKIVRHAGNTQAAIDGVSNSMNSFLVVMTKEDGLRFNVPYMTLFDLEQGKNHGTRSKFVFDHTVVESLYSRLAMTENERDALRKGFDELTMQLEKAGYRAMQQSAKIFELDLQLNLMRGEGFLGFIRRRYFKSHTQIGDSE